MPAFQNDVAASPKVRPRKGVILQERPEAPRFAQRRFGSQSGARDRAVARGVQRYDLFDRDGAAFGCREGQRMGDVAVLLVKLPLDVDRPVT